jgi:hypothetical protein
MEAALILSEMRVPPPRPAPAKAVLRPRPPILNLDGSHLPRGGLQPIKAPWKGSAQNVRPGREPANPDFISPNRDTAQFGDSGDINDRARDWVFSQGRKEIRPARQYLSAMPRKGIDRFVQRPGSEIQAVFPRR